MAKNKLKYDALKMPLSYSIVVTDAVKMGDKIREVWPQVKSKNPQWVNVLNDDHVIKTKHWDKILEKKLDGTNFVTCNDNWMSPRKAAGATMFSMELLDTVGWPIYPPGMQHLFIDDLWETIGYGTGCWQIDHSVTIEHNNQLKTPHLRDTTFFEVYGKGSDLTKNPMWQNDHAVYKNIVEKDYLTIKNKIRKLRGQLEIQYQ